MSTHFLQTLCNIQLTAKNTQSYHLEMDTIRWTGFFSLLENLANDVPLALREGTTVAAARAVVLDHPP